MINTIVALVGVVVAGDGGKPSSLYTSKMNILRGRPIRNHHNLDLVLKIPNGGGDGGSSTITKTTYEDPIEDLVVSSPYPPRGGGGSGKVTKTGSGTGTASITNLVFNLVKNILGAGVLGLPAGKVKERQFVTLFLYL